MRLKKILGLLGGTSALILALALIPLGCPAAVLNDDCDCAEYESCREGICVARTCEEEPDCPPGSHCVNLRCQLEECGSDEDCVEGRCIEGGCYQVECSDGETRDCSTYCGNGSESCVNGVWRGCTAPQPVYESCGPLDGGVVDDAAAHDSAVADSAAPDSACPGQMCRDPQGECVDGHPADQCGFEGEACYSCVGSNPCREYQCLPGGGCAETERPNGASCGTDMECQAGDCVDVCVLNEGDPCGGECTCGCGTVDRGYIRCDGTCYLYFNGSCNNICINFC